jgi:hypothetical protein
MASIKKLLDVRRTRVSVQGGHQLRTKRVKPLLGMVFREFF